MLYISEVYIIFSLFLYAIVCGTSSGDIKEYCSTEHFSPTCENDEVIILTQATYGRMEIGKCVQTDYGHLGCKMDVLKYFDNRCSGKTSCDIDINNQDLRSKVTCLGSELNPYLKASYICQKVFRPSNQVQCHETYRIEANPIQNVLASSVTQETSCGLHKTPWIVSAKPGQRLKLILNDFSRKPNGLINNNNDGCRNMVQYGYIVDIGKNNNFINICGGNDAREIVLYNSSSNAVQIVLDENAIEAYSFIIKYEVIGCPEIIPPTDNYWMQKKSNNTTVMGCHTSSDTWRLTCVNNNWLGMMKNCSAGTDETPRKSGSNDVDGTTAFNSNHVLAFSLGCVTLIVCCATVIVGFYCIKKYDSNRNTESPPNYDNATIMSTRTAMFNTLTPATYQGTNNNNHHRPLVELSSYPFATMSPQRNKPPPVPKRSTSYHGSIQRCHVVMHGAGNPYFPTAMDPRLYQQEHAYHQVEPLAQGNSYISHVLQPQRVTQQNEINDSSVFPQNSNLQSLIMDSNITNNPFLDPENQMDTGIPTFNQEYNNNSNNEYCVEKNVTANPVPVHEYFVLENQLRPSVTSETDSQLYQSIHYKSTDNITF